MKAKNVDESKFMKERGDKARLKKVSNVPIVAKCGW